jgi:hypothetical protein
MRRFAALLLCLGACSQAAIYRSVISQVRQWGSAEEARAETQEITGVGLRAEYSYDKPAVKDRQPGCAALMAQQYREAEACEVELNEMGDGCKIPGACPNCEAMVQTVAQYKADRCVL